MGCSESSRVCYSYRIIRLSTDSSNGSSGLEGKRSPAVVSRRHQCSTRCLSPKLLLQERFIVCLIMQQLLVLQDPNYINLLLQHFVLCSSYRTGILLFSCSSWGSSLCLVHKTGSFYLHTQGDTVSIPYSKLSLLHNLDMFCPKAYTRNLDY